MFELVANAENLGHNIITVPGPKFRTDALFLPPTLNSVAKTCTKTLYQKNKNGGDGIVFGDYLIHPPLWHVRTLRPGEGK